MAASIRPRAWFLLCAAACAGLLGYALYVQHAEFLDPCPLCILQRVAFFWMGAAALVAALHNPGRAGLWVYGALVIVGSVFGTLVSARHVWLQSLPPGTVPDCGMGLNYMLETMPLSEVLREVFYGSGECAEVDWTFLGLSMPAWTLIWYIGLGLATLVVIAMFRPAGKQVLR